MKEQQLNTKSIARIASVQALYQYEDDKTNADIETIIMRIIDFYKGKSIKEDYESQLPSNVKIKPSYKFLRELTEYSFENTAEIDDVIKDYLTNNWTLESLPKLLLSILRVAIAEVKYFPETPKNVIISEYTDIASNMLDDSEIGFVNSVLDKFCKK